MERGPTKRVDTSLGDGVNVDSRVILSVETYVVEMLRDLSYGHGPVERQRSPFLTYN